MIQIKNIVKNYLSGENQVKALKNISINFRNNEFVSILGPSGCGKTTLLNIIGGLDKYTSGDIIINGVSTKEYKDKDWDAYRNHYIGFIFQSYNLINHLNVLENVELALSIAGISKTEKRKRAIKALKEVGLSGQMKKKPNQLSGGQMQRVAIARAIVNEPKIILADEPTGALDSETSVQVMDILKKISNKYLIIMVTHNDKLAEKYSTRIINILDGELTNDSNPYNPTNDEIYQDKETFVTNQDKKLINKRKNKLKSQMSYFTAFSLSLKNLWSKKWKTIITSLGGSIGIIGIALILAVSTGMTNYIANVESDALGNYPIMVSSISVDTSKFTSVTPDSNEEEAVDDDVIIPYDPLKQYLVYGHYNNLSKDFVDYVKNFEQDDVENGSKMLNMIQYDYYVPVKMLTKNGDNISYVNRINATSIMSGGTSSPLYPMVSNFDFVMEQYDLIYGELPKIEDNEEFSKDMLLVVGKGNKIPESTLTALGITTSMDTSSNYINIPFEQIVGKEYKVLFNDDYYTPDSENFDEITKFDKLNVYNPSELNEAYNDSSLTMNISGIIRLKDDATTEILSAGLVYTSEFEKYYAENCANSLIARKQLDNKAKNDENSYKFLDNYVLYISELMSGSMGTAGLPLTGFTDVDHINQFLQSNYGYTLDKDSAFDLGMQQIGISNTPISIKFYPKNFEAKDSIIEMIDKYNATVDEEINKINYSDTTGFITNTLGQLVNIISYVLIAFAGISLVVSSVMIGILTYTSVVERTKEIGVLRSIGARKTDISRIFNSETILIGFFAGLLGVVLSWILTFPINAILKAIIGGAVTTNLATLKFSHSVILVIISTILTALAGTVPAYIASKKDPVICLRSE